MCVEEENYLFHMGICIVPSTTQISQNSYSIIITFMGDIGSSMFRWQQGHVAPSPRNFLIIFENPWESRLTYYT